MSSILHYTLYVLIGLAASVTVSSESSTASVSSAVVPTIPGETDTNISDFTTSIKGDTSTSDFTSTESDTTVSDFTTTTEGDGGSFAQNFTTTGESGIDFTTFGNTDSTTADFETSAVTDPTTTDFTTTARQETEIITIDESVSVSTTDGTTTPVFTTTSADVSIAVTDSLTTFSDSTTSTPAETTTTSQVSSTTAPVPSTSIEQATTPLDPTTPDATTTCPICPTTEVIVKDDIRNYIIIALSVILGILCIVIIIWCVLSRVQKNKVSYMTNNMVTTGTQTEDYFSKGLYFGSLPPIGTQMNVIPKNTPSDVHTKFSTPEKHPVDIHVEIVSEDKTGTKTSVELPFVYDSNLQKVNESSVFEKEHPMCDSTKIPIYSLGESDSETLSNESQYIEIPDKDIATEESSNVQSVIHHSDIENSDCLSLEACTTPLDCEMIVSSLICKECTEDCLGEIVNAKEKLFIGTPPINTNLDMANDKVGTNRSNEASAGMENKRRSFHIKHYFSEDEEVEEMIVLDTENKTDRHVTFEEPLKQTSDYTSSSVDARVSDNGVTLITKKFRGLVTTKTDTFETSPKTFKTNRKRKRVLTKKAPYTDFDRKLVNKSKVQKRYEATYKIIANAYFKPDRTEEKVWKHLKKLNTTKRLKLKAKRKSRKKLPQPEPKFESEPYSSLYSRLSHFEP